MNNTVGGPATGAGLPRMALAAFHPHNKSLEEYQQAKMTCYLWSRSKDDVL